MEDDVAVMLQRELTETAREMQAEAREAIDALLARRLNHYAGRLLGLVDTASYALTHAPSD
jgi:hypothetical protein